jgi:hypothetical protein
MRIVRSPRVILLERLARLSHRRAPNSRVAFLLRWRSCDNPRVRIRQYDSLLQHACQQTARAGAKKARSLFGTHYILIRSLLHSGLAA